MKALSYVVALTSGKSIPLLNDHFFTYIRCLYLLQQGIQSMRIGFISDIHGNLTALEAVLADIDKQSVDSLICLGDVATLGPQPKQVVSRLRSLNCQCIQGNHESALLDLAKIEEYQIASSLAPALRWCGEQLDPEDMNFLRSFKPLLEIPMGSEHLMLCYHGSPQSNTDQILVTTPTNDLDKLFTNSEADILIGGHTHIQMLRRHDQKLIINPGSVGSAFRLPFQPGNLPQLLPWAEYGIINLDGDVLSVDLRRVPFDMAAFSEAVNLSRMPGRN